MQKKACFSVTDYGAVPNQEDYQDAYIQQALDACFLAGGGEVIIPTGTYRVRGLRLRSNCNHAWRMKNAVARRDKALKIVKTPEKGLI